MSSESATGRPMRLRAAHVWQGEVMADVVMKTPAPVTLGSDKGSTFVIPEFGLPEGFAILRPGARGYVLTLSTGMSGRMRVGGKEMDVHAFIEGGSGERAEGTAGNFRATQVGPGDWAVIELDGTGEHNLFFQFVPEDPPLPKPGWKDLETMLPALAFALILAGVLLGMTYALDEEGNPLMFPGRRELMTSYLVTRPPVPEPEPEVKGPAGEEAASKDGDAAKVRSATKGAEGKEGGEGETRARDPEPGEVAPEIETGLLTKESRSAIRRVAKNTAIDDRLRRSLSRLQGDTTEGTPGAGTGSGSGFGAGRDGTGTTRGGKGGGPGGGGSAEGDFVSQGKIDTGETRTPKGTGGSGRGTQEVAVVGTGSASGNLSGLSKDEIERVIKSRQGLIRACYQRELDRSRGLSGNLVVNFQIMGDGTVQSVRVVPGKSTLRNPKVESCVTRQITKLKFPAKGGVSLVNFPFIFSQG